MLKRRDKRIIAVSAMIFLVTQTLIFASIPRDADDRTLNIIVKSGTGVHGIARQLKADGMINSSYLFATFSLLYGGKLIAGEYELRKNMSLPHIVRKMGRGERNIYTLRILEGHNLYSVAETMEKAKIAKADEFFRLAKDPLLLGTIGISSDSLEGYLAPDTYYYSREVDLDKLIEKISQRALKVFANDDIRKRMAQLNFDIHKTLTLASMIEKEAKRKEEKPLISAVFHNRLRKGMPLDCDPTVTYGTGAFESPIKRSDLVTYTPYNTYTFKGLPKGPICNPDRNSVMAALYPAPVDYLYFVSRNDGTHVFSKDMEKHNRFVAMYQRAKSKQNQE
jgi:UPF0755 protein